MWWLEENATLSLLSEGKHNYFTEVLSTLHLNPQKPVAQSNNFHPRRSLVPPMWFIEQVQ